MTPLINIAMMNFDQLSQFVQIATNNERYIARPSETSYIDRDVCSEYVITTVVMPAIRGEHKRVDSRSHRVQESDYTLAQLLASTALTYWQDRGFIIAQNARLNRAISAQMQEQEKTQAKADMIALQLGAIGAILGAKKAHKKNAIQSLIDWDETELVVQKMEDEGFAGKHSTLEFDTNYRKAIAC